MQNTSLFQLHAQSVTKREKTPAMSCRVHKVVNLITLHDRYVIRKWATDPEGPDLKIRNVAGKSDNRDLN